jgi:pentatricopeptide repeat protein
MQLKLFYPERRSYSALMDAYSRDEGVEHAIQVFHNMVSIGIEPTDKSLARLLIACERKNMLAEATEIVETLETKSLKFGTKTLISFRQMLEKLGLDEEVKRLSKEISVRMDRKASFLKRYDDFAGTHLELQLEK